MKSNNPRYLSVFFLKNEMLTLSPESIISPMRISTWQEIKIDKYTGENDFTVTNTLFFVFVFVFFCNYRGIKWSVPARLSRIAVGAYSCFFGKKSPANLGYSPSPPPQLSVPSPSSTFRPPPLLSVPSPLLYFPLRFPGNLRSRDGHHVNCMSGLRPHYIDTASTWALTHWISSPWA